MTCIYAIFNVANGKLYIGQSVDHKKRWKNHIHELNNGTHHNSYLQNSWNKYGEKWFRFVVLEKCSVEDLNPLEQEYIRLFDSTNPSKGYNLTYGGDSNYSMSAQTIEKMRESHIGLFKGEKHPLYGKEVSQETRDKISKSNKGKCKGSKHYMYGKTHSPETKLKISKGLMGRVQSDETRKKIGDAQKGSKNHQWKDYPRIVKKGISRSGKQQYGIVFNGELVCTSIDLHKLELKLEDMISND